MYDISASSDSVQEEEQEIFYILVQLKEEKIQKKHHDAQ
jgi:hypothetical protein